MVFPDLRANQDPEVTLETGAHLDPPVHLADLVTMDFKDPEVLQVHKG